MVLVAGGRGGVVVVLLLLLLVVLALGPILVPVRVHVAGDR